MRCLFCKQISTDSTSVEHIIPESLGNKRHVLKPGIVCDKCNNYFARKVEKPFLEHRSMEILRFNQSIESKKGKIPKGKGLFNGEYPVVVEKMTKGDLQGLMEVSDEVIEEIMNNEKFVVMFPGEAQLPNDKIVSRFLAKVALEVLALRLIDHPDGLEYLVDEENLDLIRNYARGREIIEWPINIRRIYDENKLWKGQSGELTQVLYEFDVFQTEDNELYFVLALFGYEYVINYGEPSIKGYLKWLKENNDKSPLYIKSK